MVAFERIHGRVGCEDATMQEMQKKTKLFPFSRFHVGYEKSQKQRLLALKLCSVANVLIVGFRVLLHVLLRRGVYLFD